MRLQEGLITNIMTLSLKSNYATCNSCLEKRGRIPTFPNGKHRHTVVQVKMAFVTAVSDSTPRRTAGGKESDTLKNVQKPHTTAAYDRAAICVTASYCANSHSCL